MEWVGGEEESLIDMDILMKEDSREDNIRIIYRKKFIEGIKFNIGEIEKKSLGVKVEYTKNELYKKNVRLYMAGYFLYILPGSLVLIIFQIVCCNGMMGIFSLPVTVIGSYCLYLYVKKVREEYKKWKFVCEMICKNKSIES